MTSYQSRTVRTKMHTYGIIVVVRLAYSARVVFNQRVRTNFTPDGYYGAFYDPCQV